MKKMNLKIHLHSSKNKIDRNTDIYIVNSFGQTKSFFKVCKIIFLGGSMIKHGGQNPLEAARFGCKILHGPNVWNFDEIYSLLKKNKVSKKVINSNQLFINVEKMHNSKKKIQILKKKSKILEIKF